MSSCFTAMFRGNASSAKFSNIEPAQNFRCGLKAIIQERAILFFISVAVFWTLLIFFQAIYIRFAYAIFWGVVDFHRIDTFRLSCTGCKIQITDDAYWAGLFSPSNIIMYFPVSNEVDPVAEYSHYSGRLLPNVVDGFPSFCNLETKSCNLVIKNFQKLPASNSSVYHHRLFSDDSVDSDFYYYPTIDLIIPPDWAGKLDIHSGYESSTDHHPTVVIPFQQPASGLSYLLRPVASPGLSVPSLHLYSDEYDNYPIFFNGVRGGKYRNVTFRCKTGAFVARGAEFMPGSIVDVTLPMGDIIISANQEIETTVSSIYSATPPLINDVFISASLPNARLFITLNGINFRNIVLGDVNLIVPNGTCFIHSPFSLPGLAIHANVTFDCDFSLEIKSSGPIAGPILLSYFGGNIMPTGFDLTFLATAGASASVDSPSVKLRGFGGRYDSGEGCDGDNGHSSETSPGHVCAVAGLGSRKVPPFSVSTANNAVIMSPSHKSTLSTSFKFISSAARSLTLGSFVYQTLTIKDEDINSENQNINMQSIASCPLIYEKSNPLTLGQIANRNSNYHIPYREQQKLEIAIRQLQHNNVSFVVIKTNGGGANLPGYFTLTKRKIYTVIDPTIIQTLTFGLLPIPTLAIDVSLFFIHLRYMRHFNETFYRWHLVLVFVPT
jgi:hypothetical protein